MTVPVRPLSKLFNRVFKNHPAEMERELIYLADMIGSNYQDDWMAKIQTDDQMWDAMRHYLERGADINARGDMGTTVLNALCSRSTRSFPRAITKMIAEGADPNAADGYLGFTPLMNAAMKADFAVMKALVEGGADVQAQTFDKTRSVVSFLILNSGYECRNDPKRATECLQLLLDHGAVLTLDDKKSIFTNYRQFGGAAPDVQEALDLNAAAENPDPAALKALLDKGVAPDGAAAYEADTALQRAARLANPGAHLEALLAAHADVNLRSPTTNYTPLQEAAHNGNRESFGRLLGAGANPDAPLADGSPADLVALARDGNAAGMDAFVRQTLEAHTSGAYDTSTDHTVAVHHSLHLRLKPAQAKQPAP